MQEKEFEHIFKCYYSDIYNFIYHYIMDGDDAEDLLKNINHCRKGSIRNNTFYLSPKIDVLVSYATRMSLTGITSNTLKPCYSVPPQSTTPRMMIYF